MHTIVMKRDGSKSVVIDMVDSPNIVLEKLSDIDPDFSERYGYMMPGQFHALNRYGINIKKSSSAVEINEAIIDELESHSKTCTVYDRDLSDSEK